MRIRGGGVVELGCAVTAAAGADAGEDVDAIAADGADVASCADDEDAAAIVASPKASANAS